jgi:glyoxylase-like metal-dependent hydrolase (beta-lactamase superfamily II)
MPRLVVASDQTTVATKAQAIYAFPPNRATLGGTAYFILGETNTLVDCPAWNDTHHQFLQAQGGVHQLFLTHRGAIAKVKEIQQAFNCAVVMQEQEAYLLPGITITSFQQELSLSSGDRAIWTPGHSPGSACLYSPNFGGVLFSGRHLLPTPNGTIAPIQTAKTFHWRRQQRSLQQLIERFNADTLQIICPGANIGFLRGKLFVESAYEKLTQAAIVP